MKEKLSEIFRDKYFTQEELLDLQNVGLNECVSEYAELYAKQLALEDNKKESVEQFVASFLSNFGMPLSAAELETMLNNYAKNLKDI